MLKGLKNTRTKWHKVRHTTNRQLIHFRKNKKQNKQKTKKKKNNNKKKKKIK